MLMYVVLIACMLFLCASCLRPALLVTAAPPPPLVHCTVSTGYCDLSTPRLGCGSSLSVLLFFVECVKGINRLNRYALEMRWQVHTGVESSRSTHLQGTALERHSRWRRGVPRTLWRTLALQTFGSARLCLSIGHGTHLHQHQDPPAACSPGTFQNQALRPVQSRKDHLEVLDASVLPKRPKPFQTVEWYAPKAVWSQRTARHTT